MKRIAILGCPGSGKTTLGLKLAQHYNLPLIHLDQYYWKPNWTRPDYEQFSNIHNQLCDQPAWIIDGMGIRVVQYRLKKADMIIFLDIPRYLCLWHVFKRLIAYYGQTRADSPAQCEERFSFEFLRYVWNFNKRFRNNLLNSLDNLNDSKKVYIFRTIQDIDTFLNQLRV